METIQNWAMLIEPFIKKRIIEEVHKITDQIIVEESNKFAMQLVETMSVVSDGRTLTIILADRRK